MRTTHSSMLCWKAPVPKFFNSGEEGKDSAAGGRGDCGSGGGGSSTGWICIMRLNLLMRACSFSGGALPSTMNTGNAPTCKHSPVVSSSSSSWRSRKEVATLNPFASACIVFFNWQRFCKQNKEDDDEEKLTTHTTRERERDVSSTTMSCIPRPLIWRRGRAAVGGGVCAQVPWQPSSVAQSSKTNLLPISCGATIPAPGISSPPGAHPKIPLPPPCLLLLFLLPIDYWVFLLHVVCWRQDACVHARVHMNERVQKT